MNISMKYEFKELTSEDLNLMNSLLDCFGEEFEEKETYGANRPDESYMSELLNSDSFIAIVALADGIVAGGLAAYELKNFEQ